MLLFSRFSSSSSLHLANDLGIADSLLYRKPKRFMLDRLPGTTKDKRTVSIHLNGEWRWLQRRWSKSSTFWLSNAMIDLLPIVSGRSSSSLCCRSRLVICVQLPISLGRCSSWLCATSSVMRLHSSPDVEKTQITFSNQVNTNYYATENRSTCSAMTISLHCQNVWWKCSESEEKANFL